MKIMILCAMGMSSSILAQNIKSAAEDRNMDIDIESYFISNYKEKKYDDIDVLLLAPQVRNELDQVRKLLSGKETLVMSIDMMDYGMMDGKKIFEKILNEIEEK